MFAMKISKPLFYVLVNICVCIALVSVVWLLPAITSSPREKEQANLAKDLEVEIAEFPPVSSFPSSYFRSVLKPGMTLSEVHSIVKGYKKVLRCGFQSEIYYYFGTDDKGAHRIEIFYDQDKKYKKLMGEEPDSRTIQTWGCTPGQLTE